MAPRKSSSTASKAAPRAPSNSSTPAASTTVQASVKQFFTSAPTDNTAPSSSSPSKVQASSSAPRSYSAAVTATTATPATARVSNPDPSTMGRSVEPTRLLRENPADPILDGSPHQPALDTVLRKAPGTPQARRRSTKRSHGTSKSPHSRSDRSRSQARRTSAATSPSTAQPTPPRLPTGPGRGGRQPFVGSPSGRSSGGQGPRRRTGVLSPAPCEPDVLEDIPQEEIDSQHLMVVAVARTLLQAHRRVQTTVTTVGPATNQVPTDLGRLAGANASHVHQSSPSRGTFQQTLAGEVNALRAASTAPPPGATTTPTATTSPGPALAPATTETAVAPAPASAAPAPVAVAPAPTATPMEADQDISDDKTVVADNAHGHRVHQFVNQPTSVTPAPVPALGPTTASAPRLPAMSRTLQQTNPYRAPSLSPRRPIESRYELRVNVKPSNKADEELRSALVEYVTKLKEQDSSLVIHPWEDRENTPNQSGTCRWKSLTAPNQIPHTMQGLKKYFPRAIPKTSGGQVYPSVHLGHTKTFSFLTEELGWWFQAERHGLWERQLQCESTYVVGWALYSTQAMHIPELRRELSSRIGCDIGIRWRTIQTDKSGPIPADQLAKALHFEVNKNDKRKAKQRLAEVYAKSATDFPLGIKLRLVWPLSDLMNFRTRTKVSALRIRQLQFCNHMAGMRTWELHSIDQPDEQTGLTLRKRLTAIRSQHDGCQLFHSVDPSHIGDAVQFTFHPNREEEARSMVIALLPYLRWKMESEHPSFTAEERERFYSKALYCHFSKDALDRAVDAVWNPTTMTVDSPADAYNDWIFDEGDAELDCSTFGTPSATPASSLVSPNAPVVRPHDAAGDTDSVSTIPQGQSVASLSSVASNTSAPNSQASNPTPSSQPTSTATSSLSSAHDEQLQALTAMVSSFGSVLNLLPNNPATEAIRQQFANLPTFQSPSANDSSPSAPPAATGQEH